VRSAGGPRDPPALGLAGGLQLADQAGHIIDPPAAKAGHRQAVEPVQKLPATLATHKDGDKVSRLPVVNDLHHAGLLRKPHTGFDVLQPQNLRAS